MSDRPHKRVVCALVTLGGVAALSWETVWQLRSSLALGVSALGTALTLAATMAGISVGSVIAGRLLRSRVVTRPIRVYGALELVIGLWGLVLLPGFHGLELLDSRLYTMSPSLAPLLHGLGMALLLGPPTLAMGASIPVFQLMSRLHRVPVSVLYGLNTLGASVGVLLFAFVLLPLLGVQQTCFAVAAVNLSVFLGTQLIGDAELAADAGSAAGGGTTTSAAPLGFRPGVAAVIVFGTGFVTFGLEVAWFRSLRAAFQSTTDSFAIMLAAVLLPLAIGAQIVPWMRRNGVSVATTLAFAAVAVLLATPLVERMDLFVQPGERYWTTVAASLLLALLVLGPSMLLLGTALPWLLEEFTHPEANGRLYALNTVGAVAGALLAAWVLLPALGFARTAWILGGIVAVLALLTGRGWARWATAAATAAALAVAVFGASGLGRERIPFRTADSGYEILAVDEGPDVTVSVLGSPAGGRVLLIDGFVASSEHVESHYMEWMGHLPMILHARPERALVICFGTGQTTDAVRREGVGALDVVDVSAAVLGMARWFDENHGVLDDPRVNPVVMDGRAWLRRTSNRYDVVTLEPMPPTFAGVTALYSREFYEIAADRLEPGGVVAQWLPFHLVTDGHARSIEATFLAVLPNSMLWIDPVSGTGILVGSPASGAPPIGSTWPGLQRSAVDRSLTSEQVRRSMLLDRAALERYAVGAVVISDDNQLLAYGSEQRQNRLSLLRMAKGDFDSIGKLAWTNLQNAARVAGARPYRIPASGVRRKAADGGEN